MSDIKTACVYCGSSNNVDEIYKDASRELGAVLAKSGVSLVYGGGDVGLMGIVANAVLESGGDAVGIIPGHIAEKEVAHHKLTELHVVDTMHERKQMMVDRADAFIIMPGGLGTMDEFFEIFTWWQLGLHDKPIIIVNVNGYWDALLDLIDNLIENGFAKEADREYLCVINDVKDVPEAFERAPREKIEPQTKWM